MVSNSFSQSDCAVRSAGSGFACKGCLVQSDKVEKARFANKRVDRDQATCASRRNGERILQPSAFLHRSYCIAVVALAHGPTKGCAKGKSGLTKGPVGSRRRADGTHSVKPVRSDRGFALTWRIERAIRGAPLSYGRPPIAQANLPAFESKAKPDARISSTEFHAGRAGSLEAPPREGTKAPGCVGSQEVKQSERFPKSLRLRRRAQ